MGLTLGEVLELASVRRSRPEVLHGRHLLHRPVRWVHTSELAEAAFLLKGGELLLTTGQGLFGRGAVGETAFVEALAASGVTALALELGWTYTEAPEALVAAARRCDLALVVLHEIVPFVEMTEEVQTAVLDRAAASARSDRTLRERLADALLEGAGPTEVVGELARHLGAPVVVTTHDGVPVATSDPDAGGRAVCQREITLLDQLWGRVLVLPPARSDDPAVHAACTTGAEVLSLALLRSVTADDLAARRRRLIRDLVEGRPTEEVLSTATVLGVPLAAGSQYVAVLVRGVPRDDLAVVLSAVEKAFLPRPVLSGDLATDIVVVAAEEAARDVGAAVLAAVDRVLGENSARVIVGPVVPALDHVARSVADTRQAMDVATALRMADRCLSATALTALILLGELGDRPAAHRLVTDEIGPLLEHDRRVGTRLVETLRVYLAHGSNKVSAAAALHVRRQTMYQRLARISQLIGDVQEPRRHTGLVLALAVASLEDVVRPRSDLDQIPPPGVAMTAHDFRPAVDRA
jgi:purine catabolism regulator